MLRLFLFALLADTTRAIAVFVDPCPAEATEHQALLSGALEDVGKNGGVVTVAPGTYALPDAKGLRILSNITLLLHGVIFELAPDLTADGQAFLVENATNVTFIGRRVGQAAFATVRQFRVGVRSSPVRRHVRDVEIGASNPLTPTISPLSQSATGRCLWHFLCLRWGLTTDYTDGTDGWGGGTG